MKQAMDTLETVIDEPDLAFVRSAFSPVISEALAFQVTRGSCSGSAGMSALNCIWTRPETVGHSSGGVAPSSMNDCSAGQSPA